jgi:asparagine synthetase B (glutamine-hydrolysing)
MFLSILNNSVEKLSSNHKFLRNTEKYKTIKFESYSSKNIKKEYDNGEIVIFFKGVIYNCDKLIEWFNNSEKSRIMSYPDILVSIYKKHGFEYMLNVVDGVFSLILLDQRTIYQESSIYVTRDMCGITPLYTMTCVF